VLDAQTLARNGPRTTAGARREECPLPDQLSRLRNEICARVTCREHIVFAKQHAAAGRAMAADLASRQPSIDGPHIDAAQPSNLTFGQKLLVAGVFRRHFPSLSLRVIFLRCAAVKRTPDPVYGTYIPTTFFTS
jgi:hypothetical protein